MAMTETETASDLAARLVRVVVLYRDRNLALRGVPYAMRADVGQEPRHLDAAGRTEGWVTIPEPGSYAYSQLSVPDAAAVVAFLAAHRDRVPGNPFEWDYLDDEARPVRGRGA